MSSANSVVTRVLKCDCDDAIPFSCKYHRSRRYYSFRYHSGYRYQVLLRDGFRCIACKKDYRQTILNVHHIYGRERSGLEWETSLCVSCHAIIERTQVFSCIGRAGEEILLELWKKVRGGFSWYQPRVFSNTVAWAR